MTRFVRDAFALVTLCAAIVAAQSTQDPTGSSLSSAEQAAGWRLLFDGTTTTGWRGFKKPAFPGSGWVVEAGTLKHLASGGQPTAASGDIITVETFGDFDLRFEWKVAPGANSGVKYLVTETRDGPIAHEYQLIDDQKHPDALIGPHRTTAALYDVIAAPANKPLKPAGEFNEGRILVQGNHVEHWLNGVKVIEYELGSPALKAAKEKSKFKDVAGWGDKLKGHILLQDHGDEVWFRNIRIRELPGPTSAGRPADWTTAAGLLAISATPTVQTVSEKQRTESVRRALERLPYYGVFDFLAFSVDKGTVTLLGYAYRGSLKSDAEAAVKRVSGIDEVANKIEILPAGQNDDRIRWATFYNIYTDDFLSRYAPGGATAARYDALQFAQFPGMQPFGTYPIHIIVKGGRTTLVGIVANNADKQMAGVRAREVTGVFAVENDLAVEK